MKWILALKYECAIMWFSVTVPSVFNTAAILVSAFYLHSSWHVTRWYSIFKHMCIPDTIRKHFILKNIWAAKIKA